jgi:hypothetical protein
MINKRKNVTKLTFFFFFNAIVAEKYVLCANVILIRHFILYFSWKKYLYHVLSQIHILNLTLNIA